jgi:hypothetical protein
MTSRAEALEVVVAHLNATAPEDLRGHIVVMDEHTIPTEFGWVFFYQHRLWVVSRDAKFRLMGNLPVVFEVADRSIHELPFSGKLMDRRIADYIAARTTRT